MRLPHVILMLSVLLVCLDQRRKNLATSCPPWFSALKQLTHRSHAQLMSKGMRCAMPRLKRVLRYSASLPRTLLERGNSSPTLQAPST